MVKIRKEIKEKVENRGDIRKETITPNYNKDIRYHITSTAKKGKIHSNVEVENIKLKQRRHLLNFNSKNFKENRKQIRRFKTKSNPTTRINRKQTLQVIGTTTEENVNYWKIKNTQTISKSKFIKPTTLEQIWVKAEVSILKVGSKSWRSVGVYFGYSHNGGTEREALDNIYGKVKADYNLGSEDKIEPRIIAKGIIKYE